MCKNLDSISDFNISGVKPLGSLAPPPQKFSKFHQSM